MPRADLGEWIGRHKAALDRPLVHLLRVDEETLGDAGPLGGLRPQEIEPLVQRYLVRRELPDAREDV